MLMTFAATLLTALAVSAETDTTFAVKPGTRLEVSNFGGEIAVQSWDKNAVHVEATHSERVRISIEDSECCLTISASNRRGVPARVDYHITVPPWMALALSGVYTDVSVEGTKAEVSAETVNGDVRVRGGEGYLKLSSVQGVVDVEGARGRLELSSVNERINVADVAGEISVEAVNGTVTIERVRSKMVEAETVNGDVTYLGSIEEGGRYRFASHNGDLILGLPDHINAAISVATFSGDFKSDFPVRISETRKGHRFDFTLGSGSAQIELETFQGTVWLRRGEEKMKLKTKEDDR